MGDVAASGGYLAAVRADVIVAEPATITGSIGVFGIWPVASELLRHARRQGRAAGDRRQCRHVLDLPGRRPPAQSAAIARELDTVYADFTRQVGEARKLDAARLDAAARGRVFTGVDAKRAGLVDELGGLQLALSIAKAKAGIDEARPVEIHRFPAGPTAGRRCSSASCGWPASTQRPRRARAARGARDAGPLRHRQRAPATSACRRCRRSGARARL